MQPLRNGPWYAATFVPSILDTGPTATSWGRELLVRGTAIDRM